MWHVCCDEKCQLGIPRFAQGSFPMAILRHIVWTAEQITCPCQLVGLWWPHPGRTGEKGQKLEAESV